MVEDRSGEVHLIPLKVYEVGGRVSSQFKTGAVPESHFKTCPKPASQFKTHVMPPRGETARLAAPTEAIEEVVVESLGPFTDSTTVRNQTSTPRGQRSFSVGLINQQTKISPRKTIKSTSPAKPHSSKAINQLIEDLVSDSEDFGGDDIENDPDYLSEEISSLMKKPEAKDPAKEIKEKTEDDFEFDEITNKYRCKICGRSLKLKISMKKHMKVLCKPKQEVDLSESEIDITNNKFNCKVCGNTFKSLQTITAHKRDICNIAPKHECMFCDYKGRNATVLRVHIGKTHGKWAQLNKNGTWSYL